VLARSAPGGCRLLHVFPATAISQQFGREAAGWSTSSHTETMGAPGWPWLQVAGTTEPWAATRSQRAPRPGCCPPSAATDTGDELSEHTQRLQEVPLCVVHEPLPVMPNTAR
jgi:hypothetical protein